MKKLYTLVAAILSMTFGYAATVTTAPNVRICTNSYTGIGNIVITESAVGEFVVGTNYYLFLVAPTGFEFNPAAAVAINVGAPNNVANESILFKTSSVIAVKYDITAITQTDVFTISNITMRALSVSGTTGNVTVGTGSYSLGAGTTLATVSSALTALSFTAPAATCSNSAIISLIGTAADAPGTGVGASSAFSGTGVTGTNFNPATAGAGTHTLTYTVNTTTPTCAFSVTSNMVVNAAPIVSMSSSENSGNSPNDNDVCTADNITFTAYGATTYQFRIDGVNSSTTNPWVWTPGAGNVGARNITVIGTTGGCSTTSATIATDVFLKPNAPTFNPSVTTFDISTPGFKLDTLNPDATPAITSNS